MKDEEIIINYIKSFMDENFCIDINGKKTLNIAGELFLIFAFASLFTSTLNLGLRVLKNDKL